MIVIIGCARSGTKYICSLFRELGYDVGHEKLGADGIASWGLVPDTGRIPYGPSFSEINCGDMTILHQVREPLSSIASMSRLAGHHWSFTKKYVLVRKEDSLLLKAMKYWYYWNDMAEKKAAYTYRIENIDNELEVICGLAGLKLTGNAGEALGKVARTINAREHDTVAPGDLCTEDEDLAEKIFRKAAYYGYNDAQYYREGKGVR